MRIANFIKCGMQYAIQGKQVTCVMIRHYPSGIRIIKLEDADGSLYGTTQWPCGSIFRVTKLG